MSNMEKDIEQQQPEQAQPEPKQPETETPDTPGAEADAAPAPEAEQKADPTDELKKALAAKEDQFLRLAAEYDNFRRRSAREKTETYAKAKADAALAFLPVYDNLERALQQGSEDQAFLKGVEMTMTELVKVLDKLDIHKIDALGAPFDPNLHNAVMHVEDESLGENVVAQVFQTGFKMGDRVIRFAMVKVAN
ncbi:MAG TPA: nucleotide exchange factor GrpE [Candidatus Onthomonas avicola]|nr:nucleotide exchange factor GrpE [Candidatus Onthomonas avicola]